MSDSIEALLANLRHQWCVQDEPAKPAPAAQPRLDAWERSIPKSYRWARADALELKERVRCHNADITARDVAGCVWVAIIGAAGTGKTSLAVAAMQQKAFAHSRFVHAYRLGTARIQHAAGSGESALVDMAMTMPMVLLDDVGNERQTATNAVPDVIFERHAAGLATWYTTAFEPADIARKYGDGVARRMFERALIVRLGAR